MNKPKLLIIDDETTVTSCFANYLANTGIEPIVANSYDSAITTCSSEMPDHATIDYAVKDHTGNDIARELVKINSKMRFAGLTKGTPKSFDESLFFIRETKPTCKKDYLTIVNGLFGEHYKSNEESIGIVESITAAKLLIEGYVVGLKLRQGIQPVEGAKFPVPSEEILHDLLQFKKVGINPADIYDVLCDKDPALKSDEKLQRFFIATGSTLPVTSQEDAENACSVLRRFLENYYEGR